MIAFRTQYTATIQYKHGIITTFLGDDPIGTCLEYYGEWAEQEFDVIKKLVDQNSCCVDIGANVGTHTIWLSHTCNNNYVFSFEPQFYIYMLLNSNIMLNDCHNVIPNRAFIGNSNETLKSQIFDPRAEKLNYGEFNSNYTHESGIPTLKMKLDDVDFLNKKIDFIKTDCEGLDIDVLLSGEKLITTDIPNMYVEFNGVDGNDEILRVVKDYGYNIYWHVYPKFNPDNHNKQTRNIYVHEGTSLSIDNISKFYESSMICVHKEKDQGLFDSHDAIELGDSLTNYLLRHKIIK